MDNYNTRQTLIQRVKDQGDQDAWSEFVSIYKDFILLILYKLKVNQNDCDDIVQQVFLKLWKSLEDFDYNRDRSQFRTWLFTVTKRTAFDFFRKNDLLNKRHEKMANIPELNWQKDHSASEIEEQAKKEWEIFITNKALENIKPFFAGKAIKVFTMTLAGKKPPEIAEELEIKQDSVYRLNGRVKKRLIVEIEQLRKDLE